MAKQKAQYFTAFPDKDPEAIKAAEAPAATDSTAKAATAKM
jgi:hypothetical protein